MKYSAILHAYYEMGFHALLYGVNVLILLQRNLCSSWSGYRTRGIPRAPDFNNVTEEFFPGVTFRKWG